MTLPTFLLTTHSGQFVLVSLFFCGQKSSRVRRMTHINLAVLVSVSLEVDMTLQPFLIWMHAQSNKSEGMCQICCRVQRVKVNKHYKQDEASGKTGVSLPSFPSTSNKYHIRITADPSKTKLVHGFQHRFSIDTQKWTSMTDDEMYAVASPLMSLPDGYCLLVDPWKRAKK